MYEGDECIMMKINWKVRLKNPVFWATAVPGAISLVYLILGLLGVVPTVTEEYLVQVFLTIVDILTNIGILVDPTTAGVSDSAVAMTYQKPKKRAA